MNKIKICIIRLILKIGDLFFGFKDIGGHTFCSRLIGKNSIIIDLGGHQGYFSQQMNNRYKCTAYVVEPVYSLYESIIASPLLKKYNFAVAGDVGETVFYESENIQAGSILGQNVDFNGEAYTVKTKSLSNFIDELGLTEVDLLKVDIEGAEIQLINTIDAKDAFCIKQMTVEFHDSTPNPNVQEIDVLESIQHLKAFGFYGVNMGDDNRDWFFINSRYKKISKITNSYLKLRKKAYTFLRLYYV